MSLGFVQPAWLLLALAIPAALAFRRARGRPALLLAPAEVALAPGIASARQRVAALPLVLRVLALLCALGALARPVLRVTSPVEAQGIDVVLCLDVSSSMEERDMDPQRTRLDVARAALARFVAGRPQDRLGLIAFARYPDIVCPPTLDHDAFDRLLAEVRMVERDSPEDVTGIGTALARAAQVLARSDAASKVALLFTDGEENVAGPGNPLEIGPEAAGRLCVDGGVRVYTVAAGIGKPTATGGWQPLDTRAVREVAAATGGAFYEARDADAVERVVATIDTLETTAFSQPRTVEHERFLPFLAAALALFLLARALEATVLEVGP